MTKQRTRSAAVLGNSLAHHRFYWHILTIVVAAPSSIAMAGSTSAQLGVRVTVIRSCSVSTAQPSSATQTQADASGKSKDPKLTAMVNISCSHQTTPLISVNSGNDVINFQRITGETNHNDSPDPLARQSKISTQNRPTTATHHEQRLIPGPDQARDGANARAPSTGNVTVTVNF